MGSTAKCSHMRRRTMDKEMIETDNMRAWLSLANTVLVSIAMVLWYFAIWQEEKEEIDESKVVIIENDKENRKYENQTTTKVSEHENNEYEIRRQKSESCQEKDETNAKDTTQNEQQDMKSQNTKAAIKRVCLGPTFLWPIHRDTVEDLREGKSKNRQELGDDLLDRLESLGIRRDSSKSDQEYEIQQQKCVEGQAELEVEKINTTSDEDTTKMEEDPIQTKHIEFSNTKLAKKVTLGATFQWPRHNDTMEKLKASKDCDRYGLESEVLDRLESMGIRRDIPTNSDTSSIVPLSDCARLSGKLMGKKVRMTWDNFLAKSRPGLENEAESTKHGKSLNKKKKKTQKGGKKEEKQSKTFVEIIKEENSSSVVCPLEIVLI